MEMWTIIWDILYLNVNVDYYLRHPVFLNVNVACYLRHPVFLNVNVDYYLRHPVFLNVNVTCYLGHPVLYNPAVFKLLSSVEFKLLQCAHCAKCTFCHNCEFVKRIWFCYSRLNSRERILGTFSIITPLVI